MNGREALSHPAVEYPVSDGEPMGETDAHRDETKDYAIDVLQDFFRDDPRVYVSGDNFVYYTEGVPADVVSPDCYVVRGVEKRPRDIYKLWDEEGKAPVFVLEITSRKTHKVDLGEKMGIYRDFLLVPEYFLFDLRGEWIREKLRGYALRPGSSTQLQPGPGGRLASRELGLELGIEGGHLRFYRPGARSPFPTRAERAEQERQRADRAEGELRRLREELERLRGGGAGGETPGRA